MQSLAGLLRVALHVQYHPQGHRLRTLAVMLHAAHGG
jgi:hypothetical protein